MLVNASYTPGDFFLSTVTDLCPNTTYEFAAWIVNVMARNAIKPNITFSIETTTGTVLQQYSTGDIPETFTASWKQYGFFFSPSFVSSRNIRLNLYFTKSSLIVCRTKVLNNNVTQ